MAKISKHPQENILAVNLKINLITIQMIATTRTIKNIESNPSGIISSVLENLSFFNHCFYKIRSKAVSKVAVIWCIQD